MDNFFETCLPFSFLLVSVFASSAVVDGARSNIGGDAEVVNDRWVAGAGYRTDARSSLGEDTGDDELTAVVDEPTTEDDESAIDDDGLAVGIGKRMDVDDGSNNRTGNQANAGPDIGENVGVGSLDSGSGNGLDADLIIDNAGQRDVEDIGDIRDDLIKDFNNSISVVVLAKLSYIVLNKHVIDSSARILANVINNLFENLSPFSIALPSSPRLSSLPYLHTSLTFNSNNTSRL